MNSRRNDNQQGIISQRVVQSYKASKFKNKIQKYSSHSSQTLSTHNQNILHSMNYPFDQHNTSTQNSKNQFILSQSSIIDSAMNNNGNEGNEGNNDIQKIFSYMKNVMSNPMLMDQMQKFLAVKQAQKNSSFILKQNQSLSVTQIEPQIRQPPNSYIVQSSISPKPQPLRINTHQNAKTLINPQMNENSAKIKKSSENFMAYINNQANSQSQIIENFPIHNQMQNDSIQRISRPQQRKFKLQEKPIIPQQPKQPISFDDIPIKSNYTENKQFSNFDSGFSYPQPQSQFHEPIKPKKNIPKTKTSAKTNSNNNIQKMLEGQQRPISGTRKDFKQLLKEKFGQTPFDEKPLPALGKNTQNKWVQNDEYDNQNQIGEGYQQERRPKKQFLKRGTRQYLSSAKDRKSVIKKQTQQIKNKDSQQNLNSSRLGDRTERDKTPNKRDVSQNRILSKRNTTMNDKSVSKLKTQNNLNNSSYYDQRQQEEPKQSITPKNQIPTNKSPILPPKNNKPAGKHLGNSLFPKTANPKSAKKKNVFDDSSSSNDQDQNLYSQHQDNQQNLRPNNSINDKKQNQYGERKLSSYHPDKQYDMFSRQKKQEVIDGVFLSKSQLDTILQKYAPKIQTASLKNIDNNEEKFNQLRKKYTDLCNLVKKQKIQHQELMQKDKEQFQIYKQQEIQKIKNQRRVMERQVKSTMPSQSQNLQKDKQEVQNLKKQLQKEREDHKKKQKNNKILIQKYKKQNQELKIKLQKLEEDLEKQSQNSTQNNFSSTHSQRQSSHSQINTRQTTSNNDKSKSKTQTKDVSPGKAKMSKSSKVFEQHEQDNDQEKNYKKTVPLYKVGQQQKKSYSPTLNQNSKKTPINASNNINEDHDSDDDKLPTFKIEDKINNGSTKAIKSQKKYQYIENSAQQTQGKKPNQSASSKVNSNHQHKGTSQNVFADESQQENNYQEGQEGQESDNEASNRDNFFKAQQKYEKLSDLMSANFSIKEVTSQMVEKLFKYENNADYCRYLQRINNPKRMIVNSSKNGLDKKLTNIYNDKSKQILFENGVKKQIFQDGYTIIYFKNGDIKQKLQDGTTLYYFNDKKVDQITLINGLNIYRFDNNQVEIHYDGNKYIEIRHPDGTIKMLGSPIH